jgi:2-polyprenyl-3-methyl-5-hydroxy-6-metoxy-1,4-benzoquinol methylase
MPEPKLSSRLGHFVKYYGKAPSRAELAVEREVHGVNARINSYTTPAQADLLGAKLGLHPGVRLLEVGAGSGWPGIYLAKRTGCDVVMTDVPAEGIRSAMGRAARQGVYSQCSFALASGSQLPFRSRSFDAVVHTDVL